MSSNFPPNNDIQKIAEGAAAKADEAIEKTRQVANTALDSAQSHVEDLGQRAPAALSRAAEQVEDLSRRALERARQAGSQVSEQVHRASDATTAYVKDEPLKAILLAVAAGAVTATLIGWMARDRDSRR